MDQRQKRNWELQINAVNPITVQAPFAGPDSVVFESAKKLASSHIVLGVMHTPAGQKMNKRSQ